MRYYGFTNMYLSSIQVGIQNAHCLVSMGRKYNEDTLIEVGSPQYMFENWADNHKTMICLNGGNQAMLNELAFFFISDDNPFAWDQFFEDEQSLNGCLTCVGIILPEAIYEAAKEYYECRSYPIETRAGIIVEKYNLTEWELELVTILNTFKLAN